MSLDDERRELDRRALASERTALAWGRTALALATLGALAVRAGLEIGARALGYAVGGLLLTAAVSAGVHGARRYESIKRGVIPAWQADETALRAAVAATLVVALAAAVLTLVG